MNGGNGKVAYIDTEGYVGRAGANSPELEGSGS
jgi:hypothetical protein